ncbi:MAG: hypothetical protein FJZ01_27425, partial [Candidatus Sericytochromatia bacterium]|nr:hypothetical protein [Candidatus Tanganyikabacteria bacterium]
ASWIFDALASRLDQECPLPQDVTEGLPDGLRRWTVAHVEMVFFMLGNRLQAAA